MNLSSFKPRKGYLKHSTCTASFPEGRGQRGGLNPFSFLFFFGGGVLGQGGGAGGDQP